MRADQIEIHVGSVDFAYEPIRELEAKCEATTALAKAPTMEDVNFKLQELAASVGANAVVNVTYKSGMSLTSWKSMKATGLAVKRISDDMACPVCAETIKRAAQKCRFCGTDLRSSTASGAARVGAAQPSTQAWSASSTSSAASSPTSAPLPPPLKSSDNPTLLIWITCIVAGLLVFSLFASL